MIRLATAFFKKITHSENPESGLVRYIDKKGMHFEFSGYDMDRIGHLCTIRMNAMFGLMKMESVILTPFHRDAPLFSADLIKLPWKNTLLVELYDVQISPLPEEAMQAFSSLKEKSAWLKDYSNKDQHWYDSMKYPQSVAKSGEKTPGRYEMLFRDYFHTYVRVLRLVKPCDPAQKRVCIKKYTDGLLTNGGPAVNSMKKLIGEEAATELVNHILFGVN